MLLLALAAAGCTHKASSSARPCAGPTPSVAIVGGSSQTWKLRSVLPCMASSELALDIPEPSVMPSVIGFTPIGTNKGSYIFVVTDAGASTQFVSMFAWSIANTVTAVRTKDGPLRIPLGGSVTHANGVRCEGNNIVLLGAESNDGTHWSVTSDTYTVSGPEAVSVPPQTNAQIIDDASGSKIAPYYSITCGSIGVASQSTE